MELIHTCYRITDPAASTAFYEALGLEKRRELPIREEAMNYFFGVPGKAVPELELTHNFGVDAYELGTAYGHIALTVEHMPRRSRSSPRRESSRSGRRTRSAKVARCCASSATQTTTGSS